MQAHVRLHHPLWEAVILPDLRHLPTAVRQRMESRFRKFYSVSVKDIMDDIHFVNDDIAIDDLLTAMSNDKTHFSVVLDKDGKTIGIVTIEDILEELVGEIYDEDDKEAAE